MVGFSDEWTDIMTVCLQRYFDGAGEREGLRIGIEIEFNECFVWTLDGWKKNLKIPDFCWGLWNYEWIRFISFQQFDFYYYINSMIHSLIDNK